MRLIEKKNDATGVTVDNGALMNYFTLNALNGAINGFELSFLNGFVNVTAGRLSVQGFTFESSGESLYDLSALQVDTAEKRILCLVVSFDSSTRDSSFSFDVKKVSEESGLSKADIQKGVSGSYYYPLCEFKKDGTTISEFVSRVTPLSPVPDFMATKEWVKNQNELVYYYTKTETDDKYATPSYVATVLENYVTSSALNTILESYQQIDADLSAIAALSGTIGWLKKTDANTWSLDVNGSLSKLTYIGVVDSPGISQGDTSHTIEIGGNTHIAQSGEVAYYASKYFVYNGSSWQLLADVSEGSNATDATNNTGHKLFLIGATSQGSKKDTNSNEYCYIDSDNCLYSHGGRVVSIFNIYSNNSTIADIVTAMPGGNSPYFGIMQYGGDLYFVSISVGISSTANFVEIIPIGANTNVLKYFGTNIPISTTLATFMSSTYAVSFDTSNLLSKDDFEYNPTTRVLKLKWL